MRNLNGTPTATEEGALAFGSLPLWFIGGNAGATQAEASTKLLEQTGQVAKTVSNVETKTSVGYSHDLVKSAQRLYPNKAGKIELHHITPKYLGGAKNGPLVPLDGAYHQIITNEFRAIRPYGLGPVNETQRLQIMKDVYSKFPLPPGYGF